MLHLLHSFILAAINGTDPSCHAVICSNNTSIPNSTSDLGVGIGKVMKAVFQIMGMIAVIVIMVGGVQYSLSSGDPKRTAQAKNTILYAAIGIVISLSAYAIVSFIANGLGK